MKKLYPLIFSIFSVVIFAQNKSEMNQSYQFYENKGQIIDQEGKQNNEVKFLYISNGLNVQIKKAGFSYDVYETERKEIKLSKKSLNTFKSEEKSQFKITQKFHRLDIDFLNSNKNVEIVAEDRSADYDNYYNIPNVPKGVEKVYRYRKVTYKNLYPNIDLEFFKPNDTLKPVEYNFVVKPGGKISNIQLKFNGAKTKLKDGKLSMTTRFGEIQENIPNSWIEELNSKKDIKISFKETGNQTFGFESSQDTFDKILVIDPTPTRIWGSYIGGNGADYENRPFVDQFQNIYLNGVTYSSSNFSTSGTYQNINFGNGDAFIMKIDKDGKKLWGTFAGGVNYDNTSGCSVDENLNIYTAIVTESFPASSTVNNYSKYNILLLKLDKDGHFIYQKIFGGSDYDISRNITVDENDKKIYLSGATRSEDFPVKNAFQPVKSNDGRSVDVFIMKLDYDGNIVWSTFYGGNSLDDTYSMYQDQNQNLCITLRTGSNNLALSPNPYQSILKANENGAFVVFNTDGQLAYATYLGNNSERLQVFSARKIGDELVFGGKKYLSGNDTERFVKKVNLVNKTTIWENLYRNYYSNIGFNIFIDKTGNTYFTETTSIPNLATPNSYQESIYPGIPSDLFIIKINLQGEKEWLTYFGGDSGELYGDISKDEYNNLYLTGFTYNSLKGIATPNVFQPNISEAVNGDSFIEKFADCTSNINFSYSPTCVNNDLRLMASGGDSYEWFGPNGFHVFEQNPTIPNAQVKNSGEYFVKIKGAKTCGGIYTLNVVIGSPSQPVFDEQSLPDLVGNCNIILVPPTETDGCGNKTTATTNFPNNNLIPGKYIIVWNYDDGIGNIAQQNQNLTIISSPLPYANLSQTFCATDNKTIADLQVTGNDVKWYDAAGNILADSLKLTTGDYYASQNINGCESDKIKVSVTVNVTPLPAANKDQDFCISQNAKISNLKVTGTALKFYDVNGTPLNNSDPLQNNTSYYVTQTANACESEKFEIIVTLTQNALPAKDYPVSICNDTTAQSKTEDLTKYEADIIINPSAYNFEYFDASNVAINDFRNRSLSTGENTFFVKVSTIDGCFKLVTLIIKLNLKPAVDLPRMQEYCEGQSVALDAGYNAEYSYEWSTGEKFSKINVSKDGPYTVKVTTKTGCETIATTIVKRSALATILRVDIINNNAIVILSASGDFEYSLDNDTFQTSNQFKNLPNGNYTAYVKTPQNCIIGEKNFTIFNVTNSFSPNGDGKNDTWKIDGLENYPGSEIAIYDKLGLKVMSKITTDAAEWDGKMNGRALPTATYWYQIKVSDGRILNGYLLLKNRN